MRCALIVALISYLPGCSERAVEGALKVVVTYRGFHPGCVEVTAADAANPASSSQATAAAEPGSTEGSVAVAVFRNEGWSHTLALTAAVREADCTGRVLAQSAPVELTIVRGARPLTHELAFEDLDHDGSVSRASGGQDCDDDNPASHPGGIEQCNGLDDNCDGASDEGFSLGRSCTSDKGCAGALACAPGGGTTCLVVSPVTYAQFVDEDGDTQGNPDSGFLSCLPTEPGYIRDGNDCDDGDPLSFDGGAEICDARDNNCNGPADEGVCPPDAGFYGRPTGATGLDNPTLSVWTDGGIWLAGRSNEVHYRLPGSSTFPSPGCSTGGGTIWRASWVERGGAGRVYLGAQDGKLATADPASSTCVQRAMGFPTSANLAGLVGFQGDDGGLQLYGVGEDGKTFHWDGVDTVTPLQATPGVLRDVHGLSPDLMFAVGNDDGGMPRIFRFFPDNGSWADQALQGGLPPSNLQAVHVVNPTLAYAVGTGATVLRWNGIDWRRQGYAPDAGGTLRSVLAFGAHNVFVVYGSQVRRFNGTGWAVVYTRPPPLNLGLDDIDGLSPADVWVAGDNGFIVHWPLQ